MVALKISVLTIQLYAYGLILLILQDFLRLLSHLPPENLLSLASLLILPSLTFLPSLQFPLNYQPLLAVGTPAECLCPPSVPMPLHLPVLPVGSQLAVRRLFLLLVLLLLVLLLLVLLLLVLLLLVLLLLLLVLLDHMLKITLCYAYPLVESL